MRRHGVPRVALGPDVAPRPDGIVVLEGPAFHHLVHVLRLGPGAPFVAAAGCEEWSLEVAWVARRALGARVVARHPARGEPTVAVTLAVAIPRGERMDWLVEKATELGVAEIVPVLARRSTVRPEPGSGRHRRWERVAEAATAQCERGAPPRVAAPVSLPEALARLEGPWLMAVERRAAPGLAAALVAYRGADRLGWLVGPEGGWEDREVQAALDRGAVPVSLGARILRVETAALAGLAVIMAALGELGSAVP
jgi:16S rRNA (uracil1498-N3)-methyltransferase